MRSVEPKRFPGMAPLTPHLVSICLLTFCLLCLAGPSLATNSWVLTGPEHTREGFFQLRLEYQPDNVASATQAPLATSDSVSNSDAAIAAPEFTIEVSRDADFSTVEQEFAPLGTFAQLSVSGFDDGIYYFRARTATHEYTNTHRIEVAHYSLWQALSTFVVGAMVLISLLTTLLMLHRRHHTTG